MFVSILFVAAIYFVPSLLKNRVNANEVYLSNRKNELGIQIKELREVFRPGSNPSKETKELLSKLTEEYKLLCGHDQYRLLIRQEHTEKSEGPCTHFKWYPKQDNSSVAA